MLYVIVGSLLILFGVMAMLKRATQAPMPQGKIATLGSAIGGPVLGVLLILAGLGVLASTSFVLIGADRVGHLKRIYLADDLPPGRIIAVDGQKGPQAEILGPGFHFRPLLNVLYDVEERAVVTIPEGYYGQITTLDGQPMPEGMFIAPVIADDKLSTMLEAETFIKEGGFRARRKPC